MRSYIYLYIVKIVKHLKRYLYTINITRAWTTKWCYNCNYKKSMNLKYKNITFSELQSNPHYI